VTAPVVTLTDKIVFIESVFGKGKLARNSKNIDVRCPICAPKDALKKKLAIHVDDGKAHCWVCGYRSHTLAPLLRKYSSFEKFNEYRDRFMPEVLRSRTCYQTSVTDVEQKQISLPSDFQLLVTASSTDPEARAARRYITDRGLTERDLWYHKLGISNESRWYRRIIVPSFDSVGELNYFVARAIDRTKRPKYDNPDLDKLPIIFNEINIDWLKRLVICEGTFDMFKCGDNVVPLLGSDLNEASALFNMIITNSTPVAIALDGDMWETKTVRIAKKLIEYDVDVIIVDTRAFGDPGNASKEQFREAFHNAKHLDWASSFKDRLISASRTTLVV
jgi:DNA primase